jgi:hypothetical protein
LGRRCQSGSDISAFGVGGADQVGVEEEVRGREGRWDSVMRHLTRSGGDVLEDGGADQICVEVGDVDRIGDDEDLQSGSVE